MSKFKKGDFVVYSGKPQQNLLAPGDMVEVELYDPIANIYRIKFAYSYSNVSFIATEDELKSTFAQSIDSYGNTSYTVSSGPSAEELAKRKEEGRCLKCGDLRRMSIHGLLPCGRCEPR